MKTNNSAMKMAMALCCLGFGVPTLAGQSLDDINAKVQQQATDIDQKYGVLLDFNERNDLKLDLIVQQALLEADSAQSIAQIAEQAFATYEIADSYEQRKLLIKLEAQATLSKGTGHGGPEPDYP